MSLYIPVIGGLGLFLYGMNIMGSGLEKAAGSKMRGMVEALTSSRLRGVIVGIVVTMLIQSSSATTVMVVGFVNAGIMSLAQAVGVIMGANIGTTITSQLIAFKLTDYAPLAVGFGMFVWLVAKDKKVKTYYFFKHRNSKGHISCKEYRDFFTSFSYHFSFFFILTSCCYYKRNISSHCITS